MNPSRARTQMSIAENLWVNIILTDQESQMDSGLKTA